MFKKFNFSSYFFAVVFLLSVSNVVNAAPGAYGDYDGDGTSDLSLGLVDRSKKSTAYLTRLTSGAAPRFWTFSAAADAYVSGKFFGNGITYPGIVTVVSTSQPLSWRVKNNTGTENVFSYGLPGDSIPNQGSDFDGDGRSDYFVVRDDRSGNYAGYKVWYITYSSTNRIVEVPFGLLSDRVFAADTDGNGIDEMIILRPNTFEWFSKEVNRASISTIQWGLPGDIALLPQDINGNGRPDYIISRVVGAGQIAYVRYDNGGSGTFSLGQATSLPIVGNFGLGRRFAWQQRDTGFTAIRNSNGTPEVFKHGISTNVIIRPDGTVVQPNESGTISSVPVSNPIFDEYIPEEDSSKPVVAGPCTSPRFPDGAKRGVLWKPDREGGWTRGGTATFLIGDRNYSFTDNVTIYGSQGQLVHKMKLRTHYGHGARSIWDTGVSNRELAKSAPLIVRAIFENGICENYSIPNPSSRYD